MEQLSKGNEDADTNIGINIDEEEVTQSLDKVIGYATMLGDVLGEAMFNAKGLFDYLKNLGAELAKKALIVGLKYLIGGFTGDIEKGSYGFKDILGEIFGFAGGGIISPNSFMQFAGGGITSANNAIQFVNTPTPVNAGGNLGVAGEKGMEAIIPQKYWGMMGNKTNNINITVANGVGIGREQLKQIEQATYNGMKNAEKNNL
jgi:hypothetical protein